MLSYTVTSFINSRGGKQLTTRRVLFHLTRPPINLGGFFIGKFLRPKARFFSATQLSRP
jgi:hypothetical protein